MNEVVILKVVRILNILSQWGLAPVPLLIFLLPHFQWRTVEWRSHRESRATDVESTNNPNLEEVAFQKLPVWCFFWDLSLRMREKKQRSSVVLARYFCVQLCHCAFVL